MRPDCRTRALARKKQAKIRKSFQTRKLSYSFYAHTRAQTYFCQLVLANALNYIPFTPFPLLHPPICKTEIFHTFRHNYLQMSIIFRNFAAKCLNTSVMEATMRTVQVTLPAVDAAFLRRQSRNMGWKITTVRTPRIEQAKKFDIMQTAGFKEAMDDVKHGRITEYASTEDMFDKLGIAL